ncbi:hypothetical protein MTO96_003346 [Rhipicephalus appendiculatus]
MKATLLARLKLSSVFALLYFKYHYRKQRARLENLTNRLFRQANLVNELENVFTVFDHAPWAQRVRGARKSESIHHRCESSSRGGIMYTFGVCSVFERSLDQKPADRRRLAGYWKSARPIG